MIFGVENKWANTFEGIVREDSFWYNSTVSASIISVESYIGSFSPCGFSSLFSTSFSLAFASSIGLRGGSSGGGSGGES